MALLARLLSLRAEIRAAADAVAGYVARGRAAFDADPAVMDAMLYQFVVLGEAAKQD